MAGDSLVAAILCATHWYFPSSLASTCRIIKSPVSSMWTLFFFLCGTWRIKKVKRKNKWRIMKCCVTSLTCRWIQIVLIWEKIIKTQRGRVVLPFFVEGSQFVIPSFNGDAVLTPRDLRFRLTSRRQAMETSRIAYNGSCRFGKSTEISLQIYTTTTFHFFFFL